MLLRVLSDLHLQLNSKYPLELDNTDCFTLIAGDLGPDYVNNAEWVKKNVKKGALISGNHDAYTRDVTLEDVKDYYHKMFPLSSDVTYFDDDVGVLQKEIDDNVLLVADVLYTDFKLRDDYSKRNKLPIKDVIKRNMDMVTPRFGRSYMNDFMFFTRSNLGVYGFNEENPSWNFLTPAVYLGHFNRVFKKITKIVEDNPSKDIVLMTHHCLSEKCMSEEMNHGSLNSAYISPKDAWIRKHPNIKLIVSGHVHNRREFRIGGTLYVMNPLGYCKDGHHFTFNKKTGEKDYWSPDFFVQTKTWTTFKKHFHNLDWEKQYNTY